MTRARNRQIVTMVTEEEHLAIEEERARLVADHGLHFSRSNAVRMFIMTGIEARIKERVRKRK